MCAQGCEQKVRSSLADALCAGVKQVHPIRCPIQEARDGLERRARLVGTDIAASPFSISWLCESRRAH